MSIICDSTWENDPYRGKSTFSVEVKISHAVIHCQSSFYISLSIFDMSPTFRRPVRVQKRLLVPERGILTELLKLRTNARSFTKLLLIANYVETITCTTYGNFWNLMFNVWKRFSRVQELFVCDRSPQLTPARNTLWR